MKAKRIRTTLALTLCAALLSASMQTAAVSTPELPADENTTALALSSINIFQGDGTSFNLDDVPDRVQAAIMVVRMRGEEQAARAAYAAGEIANPFTDVPEDWAAPYVAWLYDKGITKGIGDGKFGRADCSPAEYATFMLRALGYADTGDVTEFSWQNAVAFAKEKGIYLDAFDGDTFDRGTMANITYLTLAADVKNTSKSLLSTLTEAGAIDQRAAKGLLEAFGEEIPEAVEPDHIDLHGAQLNILVQNAAGRSLLGDEAGDTIDTALYARRMAIEDGMNTVLQTTAAEGDDFSKWIRNTVMAYDPIFDMHIGSLNDITPLVSMGCLVDIGAMDGIDLSKPWWNAGINEGLSVAGMQFAVFGDLLMPDSAAQSVLYYSPEMVLSHGFGDPADMVLDGDWTMDMFYQIAAAHAASDASRSSVAADNYLPHKLYNGAGQSVVSRNDKELFSFAIDVNFAAELLTAISEIPGLAYVADIHAAGPQMLSEGGAIFAADTLANIDAYMSGDSSFSVVPMPKFDKAQESYFSPADFRTMQVLSVPVIYQKEELGSVIEFMNEASAGMQEAYVAKYGNEKNADMLELILDGGMVDFVTISGLLTDVLGQLNTAPNNAAMMIMQNQAMIAKQVEKVNAAFEDFLSRQ